uniref:Uncharacterized protein n=1 Tax=Oryza glumipatula TaxID=40148 RepID=A0A0D9YQ00_9ORYZ
MAEAGGGAGAVDGGGGGSAVEAEGGGGGGEAAPARWRGGAGAVEGGGSEAKAASAAQWGWKAAPREAGGREWLCGGANWRVCACGAHSGPPAHHQLEVCVLTKIIFQKMLFGTASFHILYAWGNHLAGSCEPRKPSLPLGLATGRVRGGSGWNAPAPGPRLLPPTLAPQRRLGGKRHPPPSPQRTRRVSEAPHYPVGPVDGDEDDELHDSNDGELHDGDEDEPSKAPKPVEYNHCELISHQQPAPN